MRDINLSGHCLVCGESVYGQSECDKHYEDKIFTCPECEQEYDKENCRNEESPKNCLGHTLDDDLYDYAIKLRKERDELKNTLKQLRLDLCRFRIEIDGLKMRGKI